MPKKSKNWKDTNPKDAVGVRKWRQYTSVPSTFIWGVGVAMLEGSLKYGRSNYRASGVRASVYVDAAKGHIDQWWEGEDKDPDTGLSHLIKAAASLAVIIDAEMNNNFLDDRPPKAELGKIRNEMQVLVEKMLDKYPNPVEAWTEERMKLEAVAG